MDIDSQSPKRKQKVNSASITKFDMPIDTSSPTFFIDTESPSAYQTIQKISNQNDPSAVAGPQPRRQP